MRASSTERPFYPKNSMSGPSRRRLLVAGTDLEDILARIEAYGALDPGGAREVSFSLRGPCGDWVQVDLPAEMDLWHFHNLGKWIEGGDDDFAPPRDFLLLSEGEGAWGYWLTRPPAGDSWLSGATQAAKPIQVEVASGRVVDEAKRRVPHATPRLAMMSRGVHPALHAPTADAPPVVLQKTIRVGEAPPTQWRLPRGARVEDGFARTPDEAPALTRAARRFFGIFGRKS